MILSFLGVALQITVTVSAPETVTVRQPTTVTVRATVRGPVAPTIRQPRFSPLSGIRVEESTRVDGGTMSGALAVVEHKYLVVAQRPGTIVIPPVQANVGPMTGRSEPLRLTIVAAPPLQVPAVVSWSDLDPKAGVNFHALVNPDTVYVGEQATYQVGVFLNDDVRYRLRRNPEFIPPELRSMLAYDLAAPRSFVSKRVIDGRRYEVHVFQRALFPLSAGSYEIPPARLNYSLPLSASFFSREESHQLRSETVPLVAIDPPAAGRPSDYKGAVGRLSVQAVVDSGIVRVGDPLVLTVRVSGDGNVSFFPRPDVSVPWGQLVPAEERVQLDSSAVVVRGAKEFDWVITPVQSGDVEVPPIRYPFFNPYTERYELAVTTPQRLSVAPGSIIAAEATPDSAHPVLPVRRAMAGATRTPLSVYRGFWVAMLVAPIPAMMALVWRRPRARRIPTASERLRKLARSREVTTASGAPALRRAYASALAERIGVAAAELADRRALVRALRRSGVTTEVARAADALLEELDAAVYSGGEHEVTDAAKRAVQLLQRVDTEARPRIIRQPVARSVAWVALLALLQQPAEPTTTARDAFDHGVREYDARRFARAERFFADAARLDPTSANAWANFGTAAWAAQDTAAAAIGWQRALRLDPAAGDVRARLDLTPGFGGAELTSIPPVSEAALAILGGGAWLLGWACAAWSIWRRQPRWRYAAYLLGIIAVGSGVLGVRVREAREAKRLGVVVETTRLRNLPVLGGEVGSPVLTGEVARTVREQGVWSLVRTGDDREGWLETEQLEPIGRPWEYGRR